MAGVSAVVFALFGLIFGSFLTVVIHRTPRRESVAAPRSECPRCGATIRARDNVPVVSYLLLRGRCRDCEARISAEYPVVEAVTAALFAAAALLLPGVWKAALVAPFLGVMLACAMIDARYRIIPNAVLYPSLIAYPVAIAVVSLVDRDVNLLTGVLGFLAFGGGFFLVALISPGRWGWGT